MIKFCHVETKIVFPHTNLVGGGGGGVSFLHSLKDECIYGYYNVLRTLCIYFVGRSGDRMFTDQ